MKMIFRAAIAAVFILNNLCVSGQDTTRLLQKQPFKLTLKEARDYALQHNRELLNARDRAISSKEKLKETVAQGLPQIAGNLDYMTYFNYKLNFNLGGSSSSTVDYTQPPFDDGDRAIIGALGQMFGSSKPIVMNDQMSAKVQLSQLIFSGQYIAGIQIAKLASKLSDQSVVSSEMDIKENVTNSYYAIITNEQTLKIIGENLNNLNSIMQHTNNMYKAGMMEETDVDQLRITVSLLKNNQKMLERMLQLSYNMLKFQIGVAPDVEIALTDSMEQIIRLINPQTPLVSGYDITNNIKYQLMESQVFLTKKQVDIQKWAYTPTIAGFYSYTKKIKTTGFDMTPNNLAGVSVSVPIFSSGMKRARVSMAKIDLNIAQRNKEMIKDQLETQKKQLLLNYQSALENFDTQKENVVIAGRVYKSIQNKYKQGYASSLDLTQADSNYLTAQNNYFSSVLTLLQAQTALEKFNNTL